jgi:hypothetical protein
MLRIAVVLALVCLPGLAHAYDDGVEAEDQYWDGAPRGRIPCQS